MKEVIHKGLPISKGIAIGIPFFLNDEEQPILQVPIADYELENEIDRYRRAIAFSRRELEHLQDVLTKDSTPEIASILDTHLEMLRDPFLTEEIEKKIREMRKNTEIVFQAAINEYKKQFLEAEDEFFKERLSDIVDISRRIMSHLCPSQQTRMEDIPSNSIVFSEELVPSDTAEAESSHIHGFVTATGGVTSHAAIIARAKGIPYVADLDIEELKKMELRTIIIDGNTGEVILNPSLPTLKKYMQLRRGHHNYYQSLEEKVHLNSETIDGYQIKIYGNIETLNDIDYLLKHGVSGIGLFRSEYLFLLRKYFPSEEEQYEIYKEILQRFNNLPVTIRIFDIGGDKTSDFYEGEEWRSMNSSHEINPVLGCRAIRFLLQHEIILKQQIRALLRASIHGNLRILIPMISDLSELKSVREYVESIRSELIDEGISVREDIPIGCMIEVPSSAIMCDILAQEADFLSIGTNDLIQYVMAADRSNPNMSYLYSPSHPSMLRLIRMVVAAANRQKKPLILCGEVAGDPKFIPILVGLGIYEFSVAARHIPLIKDAIRQINIVEASQKAEQAFTITNSEELDAFIHKE